MRIFMIAAVMITLPAIIVALYALATGRTFMFFAALCSLGLNTLPFLAAMFLLKGKHDHESH